MMWKFMFDPSQPALRKVLKEHEEIALRYFWDEKAEDVVSKEVWVYVNAKLGTGKSISRTTIINFLNAMVEEGFLDSRKESGRGGYHSVYTIKMDEKDFRKHMLRRVVESMMRDFPDESIEVLKEFISK